jgi:serine/threonine protein kinase/formylglycine-generating enzyme required for sulfatase activity
MGNLIGQSLGRYHILEQLGKGGMATVFKAYDTTLERDVAIKIIRRDAFPPNQIGRILKRFEREAKALARLSHPNIVKVLDYGEFEGSPYLVLEYLPSGTLKEKLGRPLPWKDAVRLLLPIASALQYAHEQGIVHRDVKPSNVLITRSGEPMLSDFGIAKILESEETATLTGTGIGVGTPEYMAPEQWTGQAGPQADIYSLGVVLYELVTGHKPYMADTPAAILLKQAKEPLPRPTLFVPDLSEDIEKILIKALAKKPTSRYKSMDGFAAALEYLLTGKKRTAKPAAVLAEPEREHTGDLATVGQSDSQATVREEETRDELEKSFTARPATPAHQKKAGLPRTAWFAIIGVGSCLGVAILAGIVAFAFGWIQIGSPSHQAEGTGTQIQESSPGTYATWTTQALLTQAAFPTVSFTLSPVPSDTFVQAPTATPLGIGSTWTRPSDGMVMVYVPAGEFIMGMEAEDALWICSQYFNDCEQFWNWYTNAAPVRTVYLDSYWIDSTEVTNAMYAICVQASACDPPASYSSYLNQRSSYYNNPQYANYPVVFVSWRAADTYCEWAGGHLPTEAEWEKAARGTDGRYYPWGNTLPNCSLTNYQTGYGDFCVGDTKAVKSYPSGVSVFGAYEMAGNVWEWTSDWYDETYYSTMPSRNPHGPSSGTKHVLRGGSFYGGEDPLRSSARYAYDPTKAIGQAGFRCARDSEK